MQQRSVPPPPPVTRAMATPTYPRHHVFAQRRKHHAGEPVAPWLVCANPMCGWVYKFSATSLESHLLERVWDVANNTACQPPRVSHFCPGSEEGLRRAQRVKAALLSRLALPRSHTVMSENQERLKKLDRWMRRYEERTIPSCLDQFRIYRAQLRDATELLRCREIFAKCNRVTSEEDFPRHIRLATHARLRDVLLATTVTPTTILKNRFDLQRDYDLVSDGSYDSEC